MSIPTSTETAASSGPWLPIAVIGGILIAVIAFTLFKKLGRSQAEDRAAELGAAAGFTPVASASADAPPSDLSTLKMLTHGRSHRFAHVMQSEDGSYAYELSYDTGILHVPSRWSYVASSAQADSTGATVLVLASSGPDDLAAELGFQDTNVAGRSVRTEDTAYAQALLGSPEAEAWLQANPDALVELGGGYITVMMPGKILGEDGTTPSVDLQALVTARKNLSAALVAP